MAEAQFRVTVGSDVESPRVAAAGEIDLANVGQFQDVLAKAATGSTPLTVDLSEVSYCDSAAVRALFAVAATTELTMIVAAEGPIKALLGISGLDRVATVITEE
ncbi:STAS domain-containing protein [Mycobacterium crocinum]|uniref:STAS domain-containing protein n=2 Tax=Mycolicibacterium TaxID=1866885 RepID=A0ABX8VGF0_9MYCO|nr:MULTISPECIES: STAS domain-containing protein [Mycolicibacterium]APE14875.1 anti-anti-sigma factor [Mycobacterium sp. WY10]MCV7214087.1 STAS domain-containing protein [Mycolicibacterium crocinum]QYL14629.1 STAS domain-containing protein [Mycolicibacterium pallens]ULN39367.1 STAS domain-containing protein [Mycolicibacterium crocinum]